MTQVQHLEHLHKQELMPDNRDGLSDYEATYLKERNFVFTVCKGNLTDFNNYWNEKSYYELFEFYIFMAINPVA